ncbi:MAG TPA: DUF6797 domain-containing protein [Methylomirabilota bacterium]|nr:DUF6797 domain-containing protein [Methylomirabilota bacterium]
MREPLLAVLLATAALSPAVPARAAEPQAGTHATAGKEVAQQVERDWIDARWNQTDIGAFLSSSLHTPDGTVVRALSVRVGADGEGSVCYDLGRPSLRAAWTGGFLKFPSSRFGIMAAPTRAGEWAFASGAGAGWLDAEARHEALRPHGRRVVLETRVGATLVRETPWLERAGELLVFTRTLEIAPDTRPLRHRLFASSSAVTRVVTNAALALARAEQTNRVTAFAVAGGGPDWLTAAEGHLDLEVPARTQPCKLKVLVWSGAAGQWPAFEKAAASLAAIENITALAQPGPARWAPALTTTAQTGFPTDGFAVDTLTVPYANPWKALFFCSGVDFLDDGAAAVSTIHGDVWLVRGLEERPRTLTWKRFATGLYQPLGLRVVKNRVHVLGRDQITVLHDENGDDEADRYENFCQLRTSSAGGHDYVTSLERDEAGNFYYVDPKGAHRISPDGRRQETLATGFRNPNGLGVGPGGIVTVAPQQGEWTPSSAVIEIKSGGYYGYGGPKITPERPLGYDTPLCWLPHALDNSGSSQVWVPTDKWGALGGQMLHFTWGRCGLLLILRDAASPPAQGAAVALPVRFLSGPMRGTFNPRDGHLYVAGSTGWQTSAARDGCLQRVRYTGAPPRVPVAWRAHRNGLVLTFARTLEPQAATDAGRFAARQWNYHYSADYGSKDYSVARPGKAGRDDVEVRSAKLLRDGRSVFLELPDLRPVMQMEVKYNLPFADGAMASGPLYLTLNRLDEPFSATDALP